MSTPHINAPKDAFAKTVLMPGDPLRSKFIAENFLTDARLVNGVRSANGYTGFFKGKRLSTMASGMGMPSMAIYAHELFNFYGVETIIRIGSAGAIADDVNLRDVVLALGASTDSNFLKGFNLPGYFSPLADFELLKKAYQYAKAQGIDVKVGNVLSSDRFYGDSKAVWQRMGVLAVEMECAALYAVAAQSGKKALCICTVSDCPLKGTELSPEERQTGFSQMIELALNIAEG